MVLKPCAKPSKEPMVLLYMAQEGLTHGFKTMYEVDVLNTNLL